jgi:amidase/aspartyl-tRNA(Asn)/glutamyl-tRNA(Gln) amidotransferase subunit A
MSDDICWLSATELALKIRQRKLSPVEITDAFLKRIDRHNPKINAYILLLHDQARSAARKAEKALTSGQPIGPLHGVPLAIKDLVGFKKGVQHTFGSKPFANFMPEQDATFVERLERAGAIVLGKTNTPEFGHKGTTDNLLFGPTKNPFNLEKNAGGSSGGSAAAIAAGLAPIAQGSDAGGSVRIPAAWCNVYGYKASYGRIPMVSRPNAFQSHTPFIHVGPLTRTVEDAALMLSVMAGEHPRDPLSLPHAQTDYMARQSICGLKIAYSPNFDVFPVDPNIQSVADHAVTAFETAGATVETVTLGITYTQQELANLWVRQLAVIYAEFAATFKRQGLDLMGNHHTDLCPEFAALIEQGQTISAVDYRLDDQIRTHVFDILQDLFEIYDLLVTPTLSVPPVNNATHGQTVGPSTVQGETVNPLIGWCLTYPINYTGHPAASIPAGLDNNGLPVGLQIVGRRFADDTVLSASAAFERVRPWHHLYPAQ